MYKSEIAERIIVTPNTTGMHAVRFYLYEKGPASLEHVPIVAWQTTIMTDANGHRERDTDPVFIDGGDCENATWCFVHPVGDGTIAYIFPEDTSFSALDEASIHATEILQRREAARAARAAKQLAASSAPIRTAPPLP